MNLTSAFQSAKQSLGLSSTMSAVISRNISGSSDPSYTQKQAVWTAGAGGNRLVGVERAFDTGLQRSVQGALSVNAGASAVAQIYERIGIILSSDNPSESVSGKVGALANSLQTAAAMPENIVSLAEVFAAADDLTSSINRASDALQQLISQADSNVRESVASINSLTNKFHGVQWQLMRDRGSGLDVTGLLDARDSILASLSEEIGISIVESSDGSFAIYASGGAILYNRVPREVSINTTFDEASNSAVSFVSIDGVNVSSASLPMQTLKGRLAGSISVRDEILPLHLLQLDELARGLVRSFSERPAGGPGLSGGVPGLFVLQGSDAIDLEQAVPGASIMLAVNLRVDPGVGGDLKRIRDGGIGISGDSDTVFSSPEAPGSSARLIELIGSLRTSQSLTPLGGVPGGSSVEEYALNVLSFAAGRQKESQLGADQAGVAKDRFQAALFGATGVNLDEEMAHLLFIENNYNASTKLIMVVDRLYESLFSAIR